MYRNKKDVDQHVERLISTLSSKEFFSRGYSIGRLYYEVGDYSSCRRYVEQYLTQMNNNAAAHALLGQALQKLGLKEKALEEFKTSYGISPSQSSLVLNICEILADSDVDIDTGRAKYWCDKAESLFPTHPVTFKLREKLMSIANPDPKALATLLTEELTTRPKDVLLHIRLLNFYIKNDNIEAAFNHCCSIEFGETNFVNNLDWYKTLSQILKSNHRNRSDWNFQLLLLTVTERMCVLSLSDMQNSSGTNIIEATEYLHYYDQALESVANAGIDAGHGEFHKRLLQHHRGQLAFLAATFLLKKCGDHNWSDVIRDAEPLMLIAWHSPPFDPATNWVNSAPKIQQNAARRWYCEGSYRCSQAGHFILSNMNKTSSSFLDRISQNCTGNLWRGKIYGRIFSRKYHLEKSKTSHLHSESFSAPTLRLPKISEVQIYDCEAQRANGNSLHHYVWILLNYQDYSQFKCTTFDALPLSNKNNANSGPESLCQLDVYAFLYCAALTSSQSSSRQRPSSKPKILPAYITDTLCTLAQLKWWDCAYKFSRNELGTEMTGIRATLSRGIEIVRCIDNHGLDPELLCKLGRIFSDRAKNTHDIDEKYSWETRAVLYFSSAIPLLEKDYSIIVSKVEKPMFEYSHNSLLSNETGLLEECKLCVAKYQLKNGEYEKAIKLLEDLETAEALYYLGVTYKKMALDENNYQTDTLNDEANSKFTTLMATAQKYVHEAVYKLEDPASKSKRSLHVDTEELLREIDMHLKKNNSVSDINDKNDKYSSDEYISLHGDEDFTLKNFSTPKRSSKLDFSNYRTPAESEMLENRSDQIFPRVIKDQRTNLQRKEITMNDIMELTSRMFEENRLLGTKILNTLKNTTHQFSLLKTSVDQVKDQIEERKNECKDVSELKKQIAELKKDINKLKKASSEQAIVENELLNLDEEFKANDNASTYAAQLPFTAQQVIPPFNQRLLPPFSVPPNPFQFYGQNLFNLYNQYPQFSQTPPVPGAPLFDAARSHVNYPGVIPTPEQMYLDVANLISTMPAAPAVPVMPTPPTTIVPPSLPVVSLSHSNAPITTTSKAQNLELKDIQKPTPANVITSSTALTPNVLITPKHGNGIPHNYQIQMPTSEPASAFNFPILGNKTNSNITPINWNQSAVFKNVFSSNANTTTTASAPSYLPNVSNDEINTGPSNDSVNKTRTISEKSNTSVDNYDPCPDFKPIIPLPAEVKVMTGEEDESVIFAARAKLYRFIDNQWKERGLGEVKLLKHKETEKVRVLMRREQIHKICANHIITTDMEIKPMKNETKAYFWVANDFADEKLVLEKFCIRFKTADIAHQFYETFNKARAEMALSKDSDTTEIAKAISSEKPINITEILKNTNVNESEPAKTVVGGFTFSSKPAFKPVEDTTTVGKPVETSAPTKVNVFSGLHFKTGQTSVFSNLISSPTSSANNDSEDRDDMRNKSSASDVVEEFEPTAEFKPVIPMLDLVDTKTGEEDENVLFEHRAKLLRFITSSKEWKERGIGNIKLLVHKENVQKIRLLMRREQVMKVCCNHYITKAMNFQNMPNMDKAVTWCAQDFSEGELTAETFCLRFKTKQACDDFIAAVKLAQSKLKDESKAAKEELNATKQNYQTVSTPTSSSNPTVSSWSDMFKPKQGSWECKDCLIRNEATAETCSACNGRNPQVSVKEKTSNANNEIKFSFGVSSLVTNNAKESLNSNVALSGWGDKFKPKQGSWECDACFVRNEPNVEVCSACNNSRHPGVAKPESKVTFSTGTKFKFGIPNQPTEEIKVPIKPTWGDMFKGSAESWDCKQCYVKNEKNVDTCCACNGPKDPGTAPKTTAAAWTGFKMDFNTTDKQKETASIFDGTGVYKFNFGIPSNGQGQSPYVFPKQEKNSVLVNVTQTGTDEPNNSSTLNPAKPALLPTPQKAFDFVFKPKTQSKAKSPMKSPKNEKGDESDGNEYASEDEGHHIQITPIVPLPDKVKVVTGEEDEDELFGHRAKLLLFVSGEWKERGIGVVKILKHKNTGKLRVVMRREQVFKICLNHALTPDIVYNLKDEKNWIFAANDFSEGELSLQRFCLKFKSKEIALDFKNAVDEARRIKCDAPTKNTINEDNDADDVQFVTETQSNVEEKKKAKDLLLPENFFLYRDKDPCPGCRGCKDEHNVVTAVKGNDEVSVLQTPPTPQVAATTEDSIYEASLSKITISQNIFKVPQPIGSNNGSLTAEKEDGCSKNIPKMNTESNILQKPKLFSAVSSLTTGVNNNSSQTTSNENKQADPKSIFSKANAGLFTKSSTVFGFKPSENISTETKSIFGKNSDSESIFGGNTPQPTIKVFGGQSAPASSNGSNLFAKNSAEWSFAKLPANQTLNSKQPVFGLKEELSFSTISNSSPIGFQSNPNFRWEGAGQQLFAKSENSDASGNKIEATSDEPEEEYDPHYEPIVELPDKVVVTTGEEDEEKLFVEHCKLYRFSDSEWKERGVGEMKVLYHPEKSTYRLLFRRQQVHKVVLNMLLNCDFELLVPHKSDRAWTFAGRNFVETPTGEQETLAVRFKKLEKANEFKAIVNDCVRKLQATAAEAIRQQKENDEKPTGFTHLRLPKHLEDSARADKAMAMSPQLDQSAGAEADSAPEGQEDDYGDDYDEQVYYQDDGYGAYDNEEEEGAYFSCDCEAQVVQGGAALQCAQAQVQVLFDRALYSTKILLTNVATGQLLCEMLLHDDTEFQLSENTCSWSGTDYTSNDAVDSTVTVHFPDSETAMQFYDTCESSKGQSVSADQES